MASLVPHTPFFFSLVLGIEHARQMPSTELLFSPALLSVSFMVGQNEFW